GQHLDIVQLHDLLPELRFFFGVGANGPAQRTRLAASHHLSDRCGSGRSASFAIWDAPLFPLRQHDKCRAEVAAWDLTYSGAYLHSSALHHRTSNPSPIMIPLPCAALHASTPSSQARWTAGLRRSASKGVRVEMLQSSGMMGTAPSFRAAATAT